jgi:hypothetical protein
MRVWPHSSPKFVRENIFIYEFVSNRRNRGELGAQVWQTHYSRLLCFDRTLVFLLIETYVAFWKFGVFVNSRERHFQFPGL